MPKIVLSINEKGGVGKSWFVKTFGGYEAFVKGKRVALADTDIQMHTTKGHVDMVANPNNHDELILPVHPEYREGDDDIMPRSSLVDCYFGYSFLPYPSWVTPELTKNAGKIDVFASNGDRIEEFNTLFAEKAEKEASAIDNNQPSVNLEEKRNHRENNKRITLERAYNGLQEILSDEAIDDLYDIIIIDAGPSRSLMFRAALRAATHIVVPFVPEHNCIEGINKILQAIQQERYSRPNGLPPPKLIGLLPNMVQTGTKVHSQNLKALYEKSPDKMFPSNCYMSKRIIFPQLDAERKSVFQLREKDPARQQATEICEYTHKAIFEEN